VYCGLRVEEVVHLNHGDIVITERKGVVMIHSGKGDKAGRVPLAGEARRWVSEYLALRGDEDGALFALTTRQVERMVKEVGRKAGVKVTPHMLRHTCATRMVQNGQPLTVVQKILRHSRLDVTAKYTKPSWKDLEKAVESL
jgi:integrase/recombinase XerC